MDDSAGVVCVYGASRSHIDDCYKAAARRLGALIAEQGHSLVCGGGRGGLMAEAIEGALDAGGKAVGVLPRFMVERGWQHPRLTEMICEETMHARKKRMAEMSFAAVAMPGGVGTLDELMEIITWRQLKLYTGEVVILNTAGFYDDLLAMLSRITREGFMRGDGTRLWRVASTPEEAVEW